MQLNLTGFLEANTPEFMLELWKLLLSAQDTPGGIPQQLIDQKKEEILQRKVCGCVVHAVRAVVFCNPIIMYCISCHLTTLFNLICTSSRWRESKRLSGKRRWLPRVEEEGHLWWVCRTLVHLTIVPKKTKTTGLQLADFYLFIY